jgi:hypothetical protein
MILRIDCVSLARAEQRDTPNVAIIGLYYVAIITL